jgi:hypothetical protein
VFQIAKNRKKFGGDTVAVTIKTVQYFAGYEQGWQESFIWSQQVEDLNVAEQTIIPLVVKRAKLLAKGYTLVAVKNQIVRNAANAKVLRVADVAEPRLDGNVNWPAAAPNYTLMLQLSTANNLKRAKHYLGGIPAAIGDLGKKPNLNALSFLSQFNAWRIQWQLLNPGWFTSSTAQTAIITNYAQDAATGVVTFTLETPGFTWPVGIGKRYTVHVSMPGVNAVDGNVLVVVKNSTSCYTTKPFAVPPFPTGQVGVMTINQLAPVYLGDGGGQQNLGFIDPQRITTHKRGRPTYASRGRSKGRQGW